MSRHGRLRGTAPVHPATPWLPELPAAGSSLRLFCFPHAGAGASSFRDWPRHLPTHVSVCPVQLPGREARFREAPFTHVEPLVTELLDALNPYLDQPFALYGHSVGALVAFEFARALRRAGLPQPAHLFVSGRPAPQSVTSRPLLHDLGHPELVKALYAIGGTPAAVLRNPDLRALLLPMIQADFAVNETYVYHEEHALGVPTTVYQGTDDMRVSAEEARAWEAQSSGAFRVKYLAGGHFFVATNLLALARDMSGQLASWAPHPLVLRS